MSSRTTDLKLYLPLIYRNIVDYSELMDAETPTIDDIHAKVESIVTDSFLSIMSEERLREWESALGIIPVNGDTISNRRSVVLSKYRGLGKLSGTLISSIVNAFTGGIATTSFENGTITVLVSPPSSTFAGFSVDAVKSEISRRKPAHLLLLVELNYSTWGKLKDTFTDWQAISDGFANWQAIHDYFDND